MGVAEFEADEEGDCFDGKEAAVDVVAWTKVISKVRENVVFGKSLGRKEDIPRKR